VKRAAKPPEEWAKGAAMDDHLTRIDAYIGELMDRARPEDVVLVVSDHGYGDNVGGQPILRGEGDTIHPPHWHTLNGVFAAWGGPVRKGALVENISVLDIAPIVLGLLDLPLARDMDGRIPPGILDDAMLRHVTTRTIASYDSVARQGEAVASPYDEEVIERLRSLGYLD
jgi:arylsulfatase A-like enzyme